MGGRRQSGPQAWLPVLCLAQVGTVLVFMSFAGVLPLIQTQWALSHTQAGAILAARQAGYVVAVLVLASLTDYVPPGRLIVGSLLWAALANLAFALWAHDATSGMILRAVTGMGVAGIYMPGVKLISQRVRPEGRGRAVGLWVSSFTLGSAASIAVGGGLAAALGWRPAMAWMSLGPLLGAAIAWHTLSPPTRTAAEPIHGSSATETGGPDQVPLSAVLHNRPALLSMGAYAAHAWETLGLRGWLSAFLAAVLVQAGTGLEQATSTGATLAGIATVLGAVGVVSVGAASDRLGRTQTIALVSGLSAVLILALGLVLTLPWALVVTVTLLAAFLVNADSAVISTTLTESVPHEILGRVLGVYSFLGFTAGALAPLTFGAVLDAATSETGSGWAWAFGTLSISSLVVLATATALHRELRRT